MEHCGKFMRAQIEQCRRIARYPLLGQVFRVNHPFETKAVCAVAQTQRQAICSGVFGVVAGRTGDGFTAAEDRIIK